MRAGLFKHRITFQTAERTGDGYGGFDRSDADFKKVWARIQPKTARSDFEDIQHQHDITHVITVRDGSHLNGLNPNMKINYGSRQFRIVGILNNDERGKLLTITAEELRATTSQVQRVG